MVRVKKGKTRHKRRERLLRKVKGFKWGRKSKYRLAKDAFHHALEHAYVGRKEKKRKMRALWQTQIGAALKPFGISYSKFISRLKEKKIELDRKILAEIAKNYPQVFEKIVEKVKN
jgi:large subunit ribosomal protein L20